MACSLVAASACDQEQEWDETWQQPDDAASFRTGGWGCPTCGYGNSPDCGLFPIGTVADDKEAPGATVVLLEAMNPGGARYPVHAEDDGFVVQTPAGMVKGFGLAGWTLVFTNGADEVEVQINNIEQHEDWVDAHLIYTYALAFEDTSDPDSPLHNVCPGISPDQTSVVVIDEEVYDSETKTVLPNRPGFFSLACRGHAVMKMKFMGHDPNDAYGSSWQQRQATLKMITADYCGEGESFTTLGQPLAWVDELGNFPAGTLQANYTVEAKWSEYGATCLDEPRMVDRSDVEAACAIPTCNGDPDLGTARWASFLPPHKP